LPDWSADAEIGLPRPSSERFCAARLEPADWTDVLVVDRFAAGADPASKTGASIATAAAASPRSVRITAVRIRSGRPTWVLTFCISERTSYFVVGPH